MTPEQSTLVERLTARLAEADEREARLARIEGRNAYPDSVSFSVNAGDLRALLERLSSTEDGVTEAQVEQVARALCKVSRADPDSLGVDGKPRWLGWCQYARPAIDAMLKARNGL